MKLLSDNFIEQRDLLTHKVKRLEKSYAYVMEMSERLRSILDSIPDGGLHWESPPVGDMYPAVFVEVIGYNIKSSGYVCGLYIHTKAKDGRNFVPTGLHRKPIKYIEEALTSVEDAPKYLAQKKQWAKHDVTNGIAEFFEALLTYILKNGVPA